MAGTIARDQAGALRLGRVHHPAGEDEVHRLGLADGAGQALRAAHARHDAERDLGLAELRSVGGDDDVADHGELAAAAEAIAGHRRDDRLPRPGDPRQRLAIVAVEGLDEGEALHLLDVGAGGEGLLRAGDDHAADALVGVEGGDRIAELADQRRVEGVQRLRPVERDERHAPAGLGDDGFEGHGCFPGRFDAGRAYRWQTGQ